MCVCVCVSHQINLFCFVDLDENGFYTEYEVPGSNPTEFKKLILEPGEKTEREVMIEKMTSVVEKCDNSFLSIGIFMNKMSKYCRRFNDMYRKIFFGCKSACPIHCVQEKVPKCRPGKFNVWAAKRTQENIP